MAEVKQNIEEYEKNYCSNGCLLLRRNSPRRSLSGEPYGNNRLHVPSGKRNTESKEALGTEFVFDVYGDIPVAKVVFESDHFLGEGIAKKWDTFVHNYTHEYDMSVGFSDTSVEIVKPAVYKAVNKVNKYYKKAVNKHQVSRDTAITSMAHILDCANVICFEQDTQTLEQALRSADRPEAIIALFDKVKLRKH